MIWRAMLAVVLAGVITPMAISLGFGVIYALSTHSVFDFGAFFVVWVFGSLIALPVAAVLGLFVEWPKARWFAGNARGFVPYAALSIAVALAIALVWVALSLKMANQRTMGKDESDWLFPAFAFVLGGLASSSFWWKLVVFPMRARDPMATRKSL